MYNVIKDPSSKKFVNINNSKGKKILNNYLKFIENEKKGGFFFSSKSDNKGKKKSFFSKMGETFKKHKGKIIAGTAALAGTALAIKGVSMGMDLVTNALVRPFRNKHDIPMEKTDQIIKLKNYEFNRKTFRIKKENEIELQVAQHIKTDGSKSNKCLIYCHGNASNLQDIYHNVPLKKMLKNGIDCVSFDFSGCGNSSAKFISLGCNEKKDLLTIFKNFENDYNEFYIWGRSMGAATTLLFLKEYQNQTFFKKIKGIILDSPFYSLKELTISKAKPILKLNIITDQVFKSVNKRFKQKTNCDIEKINPGEKISSLKIPMLIIGAKNDMLISSEQFNKIYNEYGSAVNDFNQKKIKIYEGEFKEGIPHGHNTPRYNVPIDFIFNFG